MKKEEFNLYYARYNEFNTMVDRLKFCMEVLKPTTCNKIGTFLNIPVPTISRIKNGETKNSNEGYLRAIAGYFDVTYEWLTISKYYPIDPNDCFKNCIGNDLKSFDSILKNTIKENDTLAFNDLNEYNQAIKAFPLYKDLIPEFINYLVKKGYLEKVMDNNVSQILNKIEENKKGIRDGDNTEDSLKQLAKEKRRRRNIDIDELREQVNKINKAKNK